MDEFITRIRKLPSCRDAIIVAVIEANLDWMRAKFIAQHLHKYNPIVCMHEDPDNKQRPGVWMTNPRKEQMNNDVEFFMKLDSMHILPLAHQTHQLVCTGDRSEATNTAKLFQDQLKSYRRKVDRSNTDPSKEGKARYTGKAAGSKDDLVIAFQLALTWGIQYLGDESYMGQFDEAPFVVFNKIRPEFNELYN